MCLLVSPIVCWENLPQLQSGKRNEYFVVKDDGGYEYGYDGGIGSFAKQSGNTNNEVNGHFSYPSENGEVIDIKYTAGVDGYIPNSVSSTQLSRSGSASLGSNPIIPTSGSHSYSYKTNHGQNSANNGGSYSYTNSYGHPLTKISSNDGNDGSSAYSYSAQSVTANNYDRHWNAKQYQDDGNNKWNGNQKNDASYGFAYNAGDSSRQESANEDGTINGKYSFTNEDGLHEVQYVAGAETGFKITGFKGFEQNVGKVQGSEWQTKKFDTPDVAYSAEHKSPKSQSWNQKSYDNESGDASYKFGYNTGSLARHEESNANGEVVGQYSFTDTAGQHDLHYIAGDKTGFIVTGGSLSSTNGGAATNGGQFTRSNQQTVTANAWNTNYNAGNDVYHNQNSQFKENIQNNGGAYKLQYQVGGGSQRNTQDQYSVTKLLPTSGNSKFGYILESQ